MMFSKENWAIWPHYFIPGFLESCPWWSHYTIEIYLFIFANDKAEVLETLQPPLYLPRIIQLSPPVLWFSSLSFVNIHMEPDDSAYCSSSSLLPPPPRFKAEIWGVAHAWVEGGVTTRENNVTFFPMCICFSMQLPTSPTERICKVRGIRKCKKIIVWLWSIL